MKNGLSVRECTPKQYAKELRRLGRWLREPVPFLQAPYYGQWQQKDGKTVVYFVAHDGTEVVAAGLAVKYDAPGGISFFYCPYGPIARDFTPDLLQTLRKFFAGIAKRAGASFVRFDNHPAGSRPVPNHLARTASLQPRAEWVLDITAKQEDIWMGMHKHARYNVRLAERASARLQFYKPAEAPLETFLELMHTTAGRDSFSLNTRGYYEAVLQTVPPENGFVALCTIDEKPAAVALFAEYDGVLHYVFAGSSDDFRKIAPPYFLIWNAILEAKKRGWSALNFGGISDEVKGTHLAGVTGFKKRFGGRAVTHANPVDLVYNHPKYTAFSLYKRIKR